MFRYLALSVAASLLVTSLQAQSSFSDNFDRPDGTDLGADWTEYVGDWEIFNNVARSGQADMTTEKLLVHEGLTIDRGFTIEADFNWTPLRNQWNGIAWNVTGTGEYYLFRVRADRGQVQALKRTGGTDAAIFTLPNNSVSITENVFHRLMISGDGSGNFAWTISRDGETLANGAFSDEGALLPNGPAGVYGGREAVEVDNFHVETFNVQVEEPEVRIGTAVEVYFETTLGGFYQIESSADLEEWVAEGELIGGDGSEVSRLFSTRNTDRKFFRVLTTTE